MAVRNKGETLYLSLILNNAYSDIYIEYYHVCMCFSRVKPSASASANGEFPTNPESSPSDTPQTLTPQEGPSLRHMCYRESDLWVSRRGGTRGIVSRVPLTLYVILPTFAVLDIYTLLYHAYTHCIYVSWLSVIVELHLASILGVEVEFLNRENHLLVVPA